MNADNGEQKLNLRCKQEGTWEVCWKQWSWN